MLRSKMQCSTALLTVVALSSVLLWTAATADVQLQSAGRATPKCRVEEPNVCACKAGSCAGCPQCAGCPDHLCVDAPTVVVADKGTRHADVVPKWAQEQPPMKRLALQQAAQINTVISQSDIICDGKERTVVIPKQVDPYNPGAGLTCQRASFGFCASRAEITCKGYPTPVGPTTSGDSNGSDAPLLIHPDNPLIFNLAPGLFLSALAWRVYDVGTGGAKMVGNYAAGSGLSSEVLGYEWTKPPGETDFKGDCGACADCTVDKGIKDMKLTAIDGTGFTSFELSQLYGTPRCGPSCYDLDGSYWTGMTYTCKRSSCEDVDLNTPGKQPYVCPSGMMITGTKDPNKPPSDENCCEFTPTCGDVSPLPGDQPYPCLAIGGCQDGNPNNCYQNRPGSENLPLTGNEARDLATCCDISQTPQSDPDVYVLKTAKQPTSGVVGSTFTFEIQVGVKGLANAVANNVVLQDQLPDGLVLDGVEETYKPWENACNVITMTRFQCEWRRLSLGEVRVMIVTVKAVRAGSFSNVATVTTTSRDTNPDNNESTDQVEALGACCNKQTNPPSCEDVLSQAQCRAPAQWYPTRSCDQIDCEPLGDTGACCLDKFGTCLDRTFQTACNNAKGSWYSGRLCSEVKAQGLCKTPLGACCNVKDGQCSENVEILKCDLKWSTWWIGGSCDSDGYCSGACCDVKNGGCYQSKKNDCTKPTQTWTLYGQCDPLKCPAGDGCTPAWYQCKPSIWGQPDSCCPGYECKEAPKGAKVGKYICTPQFVPTCGKDAMSCGGKSNGICCEGYACYWDPKANKGSCWPEPSPDSCHKDGDACYNDMDCCYGSRCYFGPAKKGSKTGKGKGGKKGGADVGQCVPLSHDRCHKDCYDYDCYTERKKDCDAYYATSAARLSPNGAKHLQ